MEICNGLESANRPQVASPMCKGRTKKQTFSEVLDGSQEHKVSQKKKKGKKYIFEFTLTEIWTVGWGTAGRGRDAKGV